MEPSKCYDDKDVWLSWVSIVMLTACVVCLLIGIFNYDPRMIIASFILFLIHYIARCILAVKRSNIIG